MCVDVQSVLLDKNIGIYIYVVVLCCYWFGTKRKVKRNEKACVCVQ